MSKKLSHEDFERRVFEVWGNEVKLLSEYTKNDEKVLVQYSCGHSNWKAPSKLLDHQGCSECKYKKISAAKTKTTEQFVLELQSKGLKYDVLEDYTGVGTPIRVKNLSCCHIYSARPGNILNGSGCPICHGFKTTETFKEAIEQKYPGEYEVVGEYVNNRAPILVRHKKCGCEWDVIPKDLLRKIRCPNCNKSSGETAIEHFLIEIGADYVAQFRLDDCRDIRPLPFDFAIFTSTGIKLIEFDGSQHFEKARFQTENQFSSCQKHDKIKNDYCKKNNIPLLRIPYWKAKRCKSEIISFLLE